MKVDVNLILTRVEERIGQEMTAFKQEIAESSHPDETWSDLMLAEIVAVKHIGTAILTVLGKVELDES